MDLRIQSEKSLAQEPREERIPLPVESMQSVANLFAISKKQVEDKITEIFKVRPHKEQIDAIHHLLNYREDLILVAKTGWGKSLIFQSIPILRPSKGICLMIMPLTLLEEDQAKHINAVDGCTACVLNAETNEKYLRQKIKSGEYTHVLTSPEIALSPSFLKVLHHKPFIDRLVLVAFDELHVAEQWGKKFRQEYSRLKVLRARIGSKVPWFGTSATLDPEMLQAIKDSAGFSDDVRLITTNIDRPDIFYNIQPIKNPIGSFEDLFFVTQPVPSKSGPCIPKTIIYCNHIKEIIEVVNQLQKWIKIRNTSQIVMPFYSELSQKMKAQISEEFARPKSKHRIIVATDAMGMGINNPDIARVVNWRQPPSLCALMQRAGRAARSPNMTGEFILFLESWCFDGTIDMRASSSKKRKDTKQLTPFEDNPSSNSDFASSEEEPWSSRQRKKNQRSRQEKTPPGMLKVINGRCFRREILSFFGQSIEVVPELCCSKCNPENAIIHRPDFREPLKQLTKEDVWVPTWLKDRVKKSFAEWRKRVAVTHFADSFLDTPALEMALEPKIMDKWVDHCFEMTSVEGFRLWASNWHWVEYENFAEELSEKISEVTLPYLNHRKPLQSIDSNKLPPSTPGSQLKRKRLGK